MIPEFGMYALLLATGFALIQPVLFAINSRTGLSTIRILSLGQILFILLAVASLVLSFIANDFSVNYVASNSSSILPNVYKVTALWGAHEGSLLLWILILSAWGFVMIVFAKNHDFNNKALLVLNVVNAALLLLLLSNSNPFTRIFPNTPFEGAELNPLLQDFAMIIHPPFLYLGYAGCAIPYAFAMAGLFSKKPIENWSRIIRPWVLVVWSLLTLGIVLGSWWAYSELGWGGWWFWDPVENASFIPWLMLSALVHCLVLADKNNYFIKPAMLLCILTFGLSLIGTFLVRSGIVMSVHSFASDPERGIAILLLIMLLIGGSLYLFFTRFPSNKISLKLSTLQLILTSNILLILVATGVVLLGTLYPLIHQLFFKQQISVGYPYFNIMFIPIVLMMITLMIPLYINTKLRILFIISMSIMISVIFLQLVFAEIKISALVGLSYAFLIIFTNLKSTLNFSHFGIAVTIIGIAIVSNYEREHEISMKIGDQIRLASYIINFEKIRLQEGANYISHRAEFAINKNNESIGYIYPEKRDYLVTNNLMSETGIYSTLFADIYVALGEKLALDTWSVRVYYKPFVSWIWLGGCIMALGMLLRAGSRRLT